MLNNFFTAFAATKIAEMRVVYGPAPSNNTATTILNQIILNLDRYAKYVLVFIFAITGIVIYLRHFRKK